MKCGTGADCGARARAAPAARLLHSYIKRHSPATRLLHSYIKRHSPATRLFHSCVLCKATLAWRQEAVSRLDPARCVVRQPPKPRETPQHAPQRRREAQPPAPHRHFTNRRVPLRKSAIRRASERVRGQVSNVSSWWNQQGFRVPPSPTFPPTARPTVWWNQRTKSKAFRVAGSRSCAKRHSPGGPHEARARQGARPIAPRAPRCLCRRPLDHFRCGIRLPLRAARRRSLSRWQRPCPTRRASPRLNSPHP